MTHARHELDLRGRVAVVTGAAGLLGEQHCIALAQAGATVVAVDVHPGVNDVAARIAAETDRRVVGRVLDITDAAAVKDFAAEVLATHQRVDVLVNNAALNEKVEDPQHGADETRFETYDVALFRRALDVNVTGTLLCAQQLGQIMAAHGGGSIINVSSTYGLVSPDQRLYRSPDGTQLLYKSPAYPATKAAVLGLTKYLATYWGAQGVRVNALCPGGVGTEGTAPFFRERYAERTPLGRMADRTDYRGAIVFLASDASRYMTGATLVVDGGWTAW